MKSRSREIGCNNDIIPVTFDNSAAAEVPVKFHSDLEMSEPESRGFETKWIEAQMYTMQATSRVGSLFSSVNEDSIELFKVYPRFNYPACAPNPNTWNWNFCNIMDVFYIQDSRNSWVDWNSTI